MLDLHFNNKKIRKLDLLWKMLLQRFWTKIETKNWNKKIEKVSFDLRDYFYAELHNMQHVFCPPKNWCKALNLLLENIFVLWNKECVHYLTCSLKNTNFTIFLINNMMYCFQNCEVI